MAPTSIRPIELADAPGVAGIYNHYIRNTATTFEEKVVSNREMERRIADQPESLPWLVVVEEGQVVGYALASNWKSRCAYANSVESSIYLHPQHTGKGWGGLLYPALLNQLFTLGYHTIIGGIALPNPASIRLHEKLGFEKVGQFREVGNKFDRWIDVGYWQLLVPTNEGVSDSFS
ncbi:MAG: arsinothricin resistance N-acetyltransferase ArsN1 family B [Salibacteraceae bacterium]